MVNERKYPKALGSKTGSVKHRELKHRDLNIQVSTLPHKRGLVVGRLARACMSLVEVNQGFKPL